ncbi:hypothetical protein [Pelotomaculum schinkii]|uniref:hypothetical protein n=1 Tax=Pelotomaculum schinkii TaxID=78350 RepID=UPI00167DAAEF|nr:hypothetical protein [Pelotomaculum schinkii]
MEEKNKSRRLKSDDDKSFDSNIVVSSECTGLIPTPPLSVAETESYTEIYHIPQTKIKADKDLQHK